MQTTPHGPDLQVKDDQRHGPPGGSSGRTFFSGARRAGSRPRPDANVIALRQHAHHRPDDTNKRELGGAASTPSGSSVDRAFDRTAARVSTNPGTPRRLVRQVRPWVARTPACTSAFAMSGSVQQPKRAHCSGEQRALLWCEQRSLCRIRYWRAGRGAASTGFWARACLTNDHRAARGARESGLPGRLRLGSGRRVCRTWSQSRGTA